MTDVWLPRRLVYAPFQLLAPSEVEVDAPDAQPIAVSSLPVSAHPPVDLAALVARSPALATPHSDHAAHAASAHVPASHGGAPSLVLARALEDATLLELRWIHSSLASAPETSAAPADAGAWHVPHASSAPHLFQFAAPILPGVAIFFDEPSATLQVLAVTLTGYLYRLSFASPDYFASEQLPDATVSEYRIAQLNVVDEYGQIFPGRLPELAHVVNAGSILVTCDDGIVIKLEQSRSYQSASGFEPSWFEYVLNPVGRLYWPRMLSLKPTSTSGEEDGSSPYRALSVASCSKDFGQNLAFVVSKDRKLRVWDLVQLSCLHTVSLPKSAQATNDRSDAPDGSEHVFSPQAKPVVTLIECSKSTLQLLVHVPAAGAAGNFFVLYELHMGKGKNASKVESIEPIWSVECAPDTAMSDLELRDVALVKFGAAGLRLWAVWDDSGNPLVKNINVLEEQYHEADSSTLSIAANSGPASWSTVHDARSFLPLHGSAFELAVSAVPDVREDLADFFLERIFDAGRFSQRSIEAALAKYEEGLLRTLGPDALPPELHESMAFDTLRDHCFNVVGSSIELDTDPGTGNALVPQYMSALRREWMRFVGYIESFQSAARWPLGFIRPSLPSPRKALPSAPALLTRDYFVTAAVEDAASAFLRISAEIDAGYPASSSAGSRRRNRETAKAAADEKAYLTSPSESANQSRHILANTPLDQNGKSLFLLVESTVSLANSTPASELLAFWRDISTRFSGLVTQTVEDEVSAIWDETLNEVVGDDAFRFLAETCRKIEGVEAALTVWADLLSDEGGLQDVPTSNVLAASQLDSVLLTDSLTALLRERHQSACLLTFILACLWVSNGLEVLVPSIPSLFCRAISALKVSGALLEAGSLAGAPNVAPPAALLPAEEDVAEQFGLMNVSSSRQNAAGGPALSPLHYALQKNLLPAPFVDVVPDAPSNWTPDLVLGANTLALYTYLSAVHKVATPAQPALTEHLSLLAQNWLQAGYTSAADQVLTAYPVSLAGTFLMGISLLLHDEAGDEDVAAGEISAKFDLVGTWLGSLDALADDGSGLLLVLPSLVADLAPYDAAVAMYFYHLSSLFLSLERPAEVAWYGSSALALFQTGAKRELIEAGGMTKQALKALVSDLSFSTFRAQVQLRDFAGAYGTIMASADKSFKGECIHSLVTAMCEAGEVPSLLRFNFSGLQAEVEKALNFKARNSNPFATPNYFHILYSYFVHRGDLKAAGAVMYQHAHHLAEQHERQAAGSAQLAEEFTATATVQAESLLCAMNVLALVPSQDAWFANAIAPASTLSGAGARRVFDERAQADEEDRVSRGRKSRVTHYVPEEAFGAASGPLELVRLEDIRKEYALLRARLDLAKQYAELAAPQSRLAAADAVALYVRAEKFDEALRVARALAVDASVVLQALTSRATRLSARGSSRAEELRAAGVDAQGGGAAFAQLREEVEGQQWDEARFLAASELSCAWEGAPEDKAWRYVRVVLDNTPEDARTHYYQVVLARALDEGGSAATPLPAWLTRWFALNKPDLLLRAYMRAGRLERALQTALALVQPPPAGRAAATDTFVPYTLIDELVHHVENPDPRARPARGADALATRTLAQQVRAAVADRLARLARLQTRREQASPHRAREREPRM